jgi:hypothetical protein
MSDFVEARFEKLRNESDGDWNDVLQRVRRRGRRRRLTVVGAAVIGVLVVVPTALALRTTITISSRASRPQRAWFSSSSARTLAHHHT